MTIAGFDLRLVGAAGAMIGIPYGIVYAAGTAPVLISATLGTIAAAFVIWQIVGFGLIPSDSDTF